MHTLEITSAVQINKHETIQPGSYVVEDVSGAQIFLLNDGGKLNAMNREQFKRFDETQDWNGKKILLMRAGGFGDLILLTPVLREIKLRWPKAHVAVASFKEFAQVFKNLPFVDETIAYPVATEAFNTFDAHIAFENAIEKNPRANEIHMTDLFAEIVGLTNLSNKKPELALTPNEVIWALEAYPRTDGVQRLIVQSGASGLARNYPRDQLGAIVGDLLKRNWEVFLVGRKGEIQTDERENIPNLRNLSAAGLTFRQTMAVINSADAVLGPDSSIIHVAGAFDIPAIGLYGPFDYKLRTIYSPSVFAIQAHGPCAPCFYHAKRGKHYPDGQPCATAKPHQHCVVLASIKPEAVVQKIEQHAKKFSLMEDVK